MVFRVFEAILRSSVLPKVIKFASQITQKRDWIGSSFRETCRGCIGTRDYSLISIGSLLMSRWEKSSLWLLLGRFTTVSLIRISAKTNYVQCCAVEASQAPWWVWRRLLDQYTSIHDNSSLLSHFISMFSCCWAFFWLLDWSEHLLKSMKNPWWYSNVFF